MGSLNKVLGAVAVIASALGCADDGGGDSVFSSTQGDLGDSLSETSRGEPDSDSSGDSPSLDLGDGDDGNTGDDGDPDGNDAPGCSKVDLLFVIDDSISMAGEQANLIASFPEFIAGIQTQLSGADSYHLGVISTNAYAYNEPGCQSIGALITQTGGGASSEQVCGPFAAGRYMTEADDLASTFACAAQVGIDGSTDERPMQALQIALGPAFAGAGSCNDGFLRKDALLVVVLITDEEDDPFMLYNELQGSPGEPADWFAAVADAKGLESNAAILAIIGGEPGNVCPEPSGVDGAEDAPRLRAFTNMFTHAYLGDVCAPSYGPFFTEAIAVVDSACDGFQPIP